MYFTASCHTDQIQVLQVQVAQNELNKPRLRTFYLLMTAEVASVISLVVSWGLLAIIVNFITPPLLF